MPSETIQWFPGHMAKTRRLIKDCLPDVDIVIEIRDARIPFSSKNPEIEKLTGNKPSLTVLTKSSLASPKISEQWASYYASLGTHCLFIDCITGQGISQIGRTVREMLSDKAERYNDKGMAGRSFKAMVVGIPNVGKSTLINRLAGAKKARAEDRPGVTTAKQWISTSAGLDLLDTPGVLWAKFEDRTVGENLAMTGAIRDMVLDIETIAVILCGRLRDMYPELLAARYKLENPSALTNSESYEIFEQIGRKRGFLISGGEINTERTAVMLLDEFRGGKIGRISLETPPAGACESAPHTGADITADMPPRADSGVNPNIVQNDG